MRAKHHSSYTGARIAEQRTNDLESAVRVQQEKVAALRGYSGQLRAALLDLRDQCAYDSVVSAIVDQALAIPAPENG